MDLDGQMYAHLRALARRIHAERVTPGVALMPTTLVHEAWLKLDNSGMAFDSRAHFLAVAARAMRQVMMDEAKAMRTRKHGGGAQRVTLANVGGGDDPLDLMDIDRVLSRLEDVDPVAAQVAVLRTLAGATMQETASSLSISVRSAERSWRFARAFLRTHLESGE